MPTVMATPQLNQSFQGGEDLQNMEFYGDLAVWLKLGEDTYPEITDTIGGFTGGELINGAPDDFKDIPES